MYAKTRRGAAIPIPKKMKLRRFVKKLIVEVDTTNKTARDAGLQGRTIAPKNRPKIKDVRAGLFPIFMLYLGRNFPKSNPKMRKMLMINRMVKAIGEIIPIALVKEAFRK